MYLFLILTFLFYPSLSMAVSEPQYTIKSKNDVYEVRSYEATFVAETWVDADFEDAGNQAFRILAGYIFGNNQSKTKIDMTAPVTQQAIPEKIQMTAPVSQTKSLTGYGVQFTMPDHFTLETLPEPIDPRVRLRKVNPRIVAVYRYSGSWSESRYKEKLADFNAALTKDKLKTMGEPTFARYNSPFMIWFLRRNEIFYELSE
jgi:hypothetical protein